MSINVKTSVAVCYSTTIIRSVRIKGKATLNGEVKIVRIKELKYFILIAFLSA